MSAVVLWRCADCATADEVSAPQPSQVLADYIPQGWTLTTASHGAEIVRCGQCSQAAVDDGPRYDSDDCDGEHV